MTKVRLGETRLRGVLLSLEIRVPPWRVVHFSDISYVLNVQHLGGGADNSAIHLEQAKLWS